jgi:choline dehydrogenase
VGAFLRSRPDFQHPNLQIHFFPMCFDGWIPRVDMHGYRLGIGTLRPRSRGSLKLRSADPLEQPVIDPNYLSEEADIQELREAFSIARNILAQPAFARYRGPEMAPSDSARAPAEIDGFIRNFAWSAYHPVGTCRMGTDAFAVVDPRAHVHGIEGLRVVDASIMPSLISSNTNAAAMMLGERVADFILGRNNV